MQEFLDFLNKNSGAIQALATAIVAMATIIYVSLTRRLLRETEILREAETDCYLAAIPEHSSRINGIDIAIQNVGNGAAYNISCYIGSKFYSFRYIAPGKKVIIEDWEETKQVEVRLSYSDFKMRSRNEKQNIDIVNFRKKKHAEIAAYDPLEDIASTMRNIVFALPRQQEETNFQESLIQALQEINSELREISSAIRDDSRF